MGLSSLVKSLLLLTSLVVALESNGVQAGLRCGAIGSVLEMISSDAKEVACKGSCIAQGKTSGICDDQGDCHCSANTIDFDDLRNLVPSRCDISEQACKSSCHAIGRRDGVCKTRGGKKDCQCSEESVSAEEFVKCAAEESCQGWCQSQGNSGGQCKGWSCECASKEENGSHSSLTGGQDGLGLHILIFIVAIINTAFIL